MSPLTFADPKLHVTAYEASVELKELGVIQTESWFYYDTKSKKLTNRNHGHILENLDRYLAAFTVTELGWMLPPWSISYLDPNNLWSWMAQFNEKFKYSSEGKDSSMAILMDTELEARYRLLSVLLLYEQVTIDEINYRLTNAIELIKVKGDYSRYVPPRRRTSK